MSVTKVYSCDVDTCDAEGLMAEEITKIDVSYVYTDDEGTVMEGGLIAENPRRDQPFHLCGKHGAEIRTFILSLGIPERESEYEV